MAEFIEVFGDITVAYLVVFASACFFLFYISRKLYKWSVELHDKTEEYEDVKKTAYQNEECIKEIAKMLEKEAKLTKEFRKRALADTIFKCYNNGKERGGKITRRQLENFEANVELYERLNGNGLVHNKYKPEVYAMEVEED